MYTLRRTQLLHTSIEDAWKYFSAPKNLQEITPDDMGFYLLSDVPEEMYEGLFIHYKVSPFLGLKLDWTTEITHVRERQFFVDEQRVGPYRIWHHEHHFKEVEGGVEMTDIISYQLPFGIVGNLAHALFVKKKLEGIFGYRYKKVEELFGTKKEQAA